MGGKKIRVCVKMVCNSNGFGNPNFSHLPKRTRKQHNNNFASKICQRPTCLLSASRPVLSMWFQRVQFIVKKSKCAGLAQEIGFFAPNSCSLPLLVKGATQLCTSKKECNTLDLTAAQYFWLDDHNDWSRWFAASSSSYSFIGGVAPPPPKKQINLDI
jgi:hypothetical protein